MDTQNFQIVLKGNNFRDVINQARQLVEEATGETIKTTLVVAPGAGGTASTTKTKAKAVALSDDETLLTDDEGEETLGFDDAGDEEETVTKKTKATKKITEKEVNTVAMAHAKANGRAATLALLKKKFKVKSILELKPDQYEAAIDALEAD